MIRTDFESEFASSVATAVAYEMNKRFNKVLAAQMEYFSDSAKTGLWPSSLIMMAMTAARLTITERQIRSTRSKETLRT